MAVLVRDKNFYKTLFMLAIPIVLQNMVTFGIGFVDNLMVGTLGEYAISGVFMGNQIQMILQILIIGVASSMQILSVQYWGKRDTHSIKTIVAICFRITMAVTILFWLSSMLFPEMVIGLFTNDQLVIAEGVEYLRYFGFSFVFFGISQLLIAAMRSVESVRIGLYVSILSLVSHAVLNWLLIYGNLGFPALGVRGAGISNLVSRIFEAAVMVYFTLAVDKKLKMRVRDTLLRDPIMLKDFLRYGAPIIAGQIVWAINRFASGAIIGRINAEAIAAYSITTMMHNMIFIFALGISAGVGIITGKTVGAGEYEKMKLYAKTVQLMLLGIGILSGLAIFLLKDPLLMMYNITPETMVVGRQFMTVLAVTMVGTCYQGAGLGGLVKAGGDTRFVFINDTIFVFLLVIPSALLALFVFHAPAWIIFSCLKSDEVAKCAVAVVKINRFNWMRNLTR